MSIAKANEMIRVLNGTRLRYTVTVHHADGTKTEWQSDNPPEVVFEQDKRENWIKEKVPGEKMYEKFDVMPWREGDIIRLESNEPKTT